MKNTNKGAVSTGAAVAIVVVIIILLGLAYWWYSANPAMNDNGQNATTTTQGTDNGTGDNGSQTTSITTNPSGDKTFTNFRYNYSIVFPATAKNNISSPENVSFAFADATGTPDATLKISVDFDVNKIAHCLTIPTGASGAASTTINGTNFLTYTAAGASPSNTSTVYYRVLHKSAAGTTTCYDIEKASQGSATLNTKLNSILSTLTFHA